jgi:hypothetical protein
MFAPYRSLCTAIKGFLDYRTLNVVGLGKIRHDIITKHLFEAYKQNEYQTKVLTVPCEIGHQKAVEN